MRQTRFIGQHKKRGKPLELAATHPAVTEGRTVFTSRTAPPGDMDRLLKSGMHNRKIGKRVMAGRWKGADLFTLTLEERKTCPLTCHFWRSCYGNNMHWPARIQTTSEFIPALHDELETLNSHYAKKNQLFVVRLHILGDFYSLAYTYSWADWLEEFPQLRVFGFTAHTYDSAVGIALAHIRAAHPDRFAMRFSRPHTESSTMEALPYAEGRPGAFLCPAQRRDDKTCATCAACWESLQHVMFRSH